jgi:hypothetical protein
MGSSFFNVINLTASSKEGSHSFNFHTLGKLSRAKGLGPSPAKQHLISFRASFKPAIQQIRAQAALKNIAIQTLTLIPVTRLLTACTGHDAVKRSQVSSRNAAAKVIFSIDCSKLFSGGHGYKLVDAAPVAFAHAFNSGFQGPRQAQGISGYITHERLLKNSPGR